METKEIVMLAFLILMALVGCATLIWLLGSLDRDEDGSQPDDHGHGGH